MLAGVSEPKQPPSLLRKVLKWSLIATGALLAAGVALLAARPEALLFHPSPFVEDLPGQHGWEHERVEIEAEDGETLAGWYLPSTGAGPLAERGWVAIYCHGNAGNIGGRLLALEGLRRLGLAVLIFDYRGYGESSGRPTVAGTRLDIAAAWDHLIEARGYAHDEIVLWGRSLGGAVAIDQAARAAEAGTPPAALVVESSFTSTVAIGEEVYPWLPVGWFAGKIDYPSAKLIEQVSVPVLLAHSPQDELIPYAHGQTLRERAEQGQARRVGFIELSGGHNEGHLSAPEHLPRVAEFLAGGALTGGGGASPR